MNERNGLCACMKSDDEDMKAVMFRLLRHTWSEKFAQPVQPVQLSVVYLQC